MGGFLMYVRCRFVFQVLQSSQKASADLINHTATHMTAYWLTPGDLHPDLLYHADLCDISGACRDQFPCQR